MENDDVLLERYSLVVERISQIPAETTVQEPLRDYFVKMAEFIMQMDELKRKLESGETEGYTLEQWQEQNAALYADILPENYETSYANPAWAVKTLGDVYGRILSFLYAELRGMIVYAFEGRLTEMTILNELFVEIYNCFEDELPSYRKLQQIVYWFESDNSDITVEYRTREAIDPSLDFAVRIICEEDLNDLRYLYKYGEYVSENELEMARFMNSLPQEDIDLMADTYTEGYRIGFVLGHKDLSKKETVNIRFTLGFERMVKKAIQNFAQMGLKPVIYRAAVSSVNKRQASRIGYLGGIPNKQFDYDHKNDNAIYLDKPFIERKLGVIRTAYENYRKLANGHAGPACIETFGEQPFAPLDKEEAYHLSDKQQKLSALYDSESAQLTNQYIIGEERSFTIIAFPVPEIGSSFEEIFREVVRINTLDYKLYERIQQTIIDVLDTGVSVYIRGCGRNRTDLTVMLKDIEDPQKQTKFENCVADVNIPVGEVFTSPKLSGTTGVLHVSEVYLNELKYIDLSVTLEDGMITDYTCGNFDSEEKNRKYVRENVLYHHDTLPLGEFAIGTNTTAYAAARKYGIADKLPILIAEKMGPHFAVGDTCYSWSEDTAVFNPNGKEIVARDNEVSILRKEDPGRAYFNCHTDITIPYDELGLIEVVREDGSRTEIIKNGRFVLPGTEELNKPL
ncbi:aminopeptidase [Murimonas intestini]|uniref:Thermophilic metalloprotease (M29) n=1 Tax=Murimonas intestini TaxID=1337051 RepID=A0AB73SZB1_9FIRM|nr:aminopeptidase [Murimonas intestini]MCR1842872.1 aminopeptidase [Murimonas intestini]MCR1868163.1 aminopeptidase [Murimonas intestini]MCR1885345.1 aminopeptidase [Murimonas intestini]